jgi:hypothetical protein
LGRSSLPGRARLRPRRRTHVRRGEFLKRSRRSDLRAAGIGFNRAVMVNRTLSKDELTKARALLAETLEKLGLLAGGHNHSARPFLGAAHRSPARPVRVAIRRHRQCRSLARRLNSACSRRPHRSRHHCDCRCEPHYPAHDGTRYAVDLASAAVSLTASSVGLIARVG